MPSGKNSSKPAKDALTRKVVILQATARHYRAGFFYGLGDRLAQEDIALRVIYSEPNAQEAEKHDCIQLDERVGTKVRARWLFSNRVIYQRAWRYVADADLVIVEHASKHLLNYVLLTARAFTTRKVALWGHGVTQNGTPIGDFLRRHMLRTPDWCFAYNNRSLRYLLANGIPAAVTTNVQNAIDTTGFARAAERISPEQMADARGALSIPAGSRIGLFCGSLYPLKRLPMLIAAAALVRKGVPDFHLIIVGDGPDRQIAREAAGRYPWVHYAGPKFGEARALYFRLADVQLNPGLVGLGILDAFAAGLPVLTTDIPIHSPEVEYLENDYNGVMAPDDVYDYADAVIGVLRKPELLSRLRRGARASGRKYTLENMVHNFSAGVTACLELEAAPLRVWNLAQRFHASNS